MIQPLRTCGFAGQQGRQPAGAGGGSAAAVRAGAADGAATVATCRAAAVMRSRRGLRGRVGLKRPAAGRVGRRRPLLELDVGSVFGSTWDDRLRFRPWLELGFRFRPRLWPAAGAADGGVTALAARIHGRGRRPDRHRLEPDRADRSGDPRRCAAVRSRRAAERVKRDRYARRRSRPQTGVRAASALVSVLWPRAFGSMAVSRRLSPRASARCSRQLGVGLVADLRLAAPARTRSPALPQSSARYAWSRPARSSR